MTNQNIVLPAIALRGTTILPGMIVHFDVSRERSVKAIEAAMLHDQKIFLVTQIDPEVESPDLAGVYHVGTIAYIKQVVKLPQNLLRVLVEGTGSATLVKFEQEFPFIRSEITPVDEEEMQMPEPVMEAMHRSLKELFHRYCMENGKVSKELVAQILNIDNVEELVEQIAVNIPLSYQNKQKCLCFLCINITDCQSTKQRNYCMSVRIKKDCRGSIRINFFIRNIDLRININRQYLIC